MEFTEHEMTLAADAGARFVFAARQLPWKRAGADERWTALKPVDKYPYRASTGKKVLAALAALPERGEPGKAPTFSDEEVAAAAKVGGLPAVAMRAVVDALPVRKDPDATPVVPDHVPDDLI